MKLQSILETLGLMAGTGAVLVGCNKTSPHATEVPAAPAAATSPTDDEECLHADGCCGGHSPGDATCGEDSAGADDRDSNVAPATTETWTRTWTVAPEGIAEINLELAAGEAMTARFSTDGGTLKWNVHSHEGKDVVFHAQGNDASGQLRHVATQTGMYSFLWKNEGTKPVELTVVLEDGAGKVHSTHPTE